jgi:hypothetical protein
MRQRSHLNRKGRRKFLKKFAFLGAAVFAGGAGCRRTATARGLKPQPSAVRGGYRLTAHIRRYYERASL